MERWREGGKKKVSNKSEQIKYLRSTRLKNKRPFLINAQYFFGSFSGFSPAPKVQVQVRGSPAVTLRLGPRHPTHNFTSHTPFLPFDNGS